MGNLTIHPFWTTGEQIVLLELFANHDENPLLGSRALTY